jgi:hypothetical protein
MCTDAYREALTRDRSAKASSTPAPGERQAAEAGGQTGHAGELREPVDGLVSEDAPPIR